MKYFLVVLILVLIGVGYWYLAPQAAREESQTKEVPGVTYVRADDSVIKVMAPLPGATVGSTFTVIGQARGMWYFEASFPIEVLAADGRSLVMVPMQAQGDWMTTEFVPFSGQVSVPGYTGPATLILRNDNASGLPEHDRSVSIPIVIE